VSWNGLKPLIRPFMKRAVEVPAPRCTSNHKTLLDRRRPIAWNASFALGSWGELDGRGLSSLSVRRLPGCRGRGAGIGSRCVPSAKAREDLPEELVEGLVDQELASLADAVLVVGVRMDDDDPDCDSSVVSPLRVAGQGSDLVAQSLPGLPAAPADLGDKLVVPLFDQAVVLVVEFEDGEDLLDECFVFWVVHAWSPDDLRLGGGSSVGLGSSAAGAGEGVEVLPVGFGECVQVLLGGLDLCVSHPLHDATQVGAFGEQPGAGAGER
jgi:hypothetical protein